MESLGVSVSKELILERLNKLNAAKGGSPNLLPHFDRFMGEKKMHEASYILKSFESDPPPQNSKFSSKMDVLSQ